MAHETTFENGDQIDAFSATMIAEGVDEASELNQIKAWSYLVGTRIAYTLQGWFGRYATQLIDKRLLERDGTITELAYDKLGIEKDEE